jgi:hypothetical protein
MFKAPIIEELWLSWRDIFNLRGIFFHFPVQINPLSFPLRPFSQGGGIHGEALIAEHGTISG